MRNTVTNSTDNIISVNIDFDDTENEWRKNKCSIGNGAFKYICGAITKKGVRCNKSPSKNGKCHIHYKCT